MVYARIWKDQKHEQIKWNYNWSVAFDQQIRNKT